MLHPNTSFLCSNFLNQIHSHQCRTTTKIRLPRFGVDLEHKNGLLKMRFGSLDELRLSISNSDEAAFAWDLISACIVINNVEIAQGTPMCGIPGEKGRFDRPSSPSEIEERRDDLDIFGLHLLNFVHTKVSEFICIHILYVSVTI